MATLAKEPFAIDCRKRVRLSRAIPSGQEDLVLEALRDHREARMRVNGVGEFGTMIAR